MRYLLDTNVLSELRKRQRGNARVRAWFEVAMTESLFLSVMSLGELRQRVERKRRNDAVAARDLERWLEAMSALYADRILPIDERVAQQWGRLNVPDPLPAVDGLLAATALVHELTIVTRNTKDFLRTGAHVFDPF